MIYINNEEDPTVPSYVKEISQANINNWNNKQNQLISGSNIKTINNEIRTYAIEKDPVKIFGKNFRLILKEKIVLK